MRQLLEIFLTIFGLVLFLPVMVIIPILIFLDDGGPIFFYQERIGFREIPFLIIKFRTMRKGKITRVGNWLRKTGLDELPQFLNVLTGDMSIVGPRPLTRADIERLGWHSYRYVKRFSIKPGLTGLAQVYAGRTARITSCFEFSYIKRQSVSLDLLIIGISFIMNLIGKKRVRVYLYDRLKNRQRNKFPKWKRWHNHFKKNSYRPFPENLKIGLFKIPENLRNSLIYSLSIFQLGESGEGRIAKEIDEVEMQGVTPMYRKTLKLFVKEEGRHGRILAMILSQLGGKLLKENWTSTLFQIGRRMMGVRLKLLVLLAAEAVSIIFYRLFVDKLRSCKIKDALREICEDEKKHLEFHTEFFKTITGTFYSNLIFIILWRTVTLTAFLVLLIDHRKTIEEFGENRIELLGQFLKIVKATEKEIIKEHSYSLSFA